MKIKRADGEQTIKVKLGIYRPPPRRRPAGDVTAPAANDERPKLGLKLVSDASAQGVLIAEVVPESDAERKGLMTGDIILEVDGKGVSSPDDVIDSVKSLQSKGRKAVLLLGKVAAGTRGRAVRFSLMG